MPSYIIAEIQVTDPTAYEGIDRSQRPASRGMAGALPCAAATSICSKASPSRSGSSSSNFRMRMPPAAGTARRNIRKR
jgi:hypothetical protein